MPVRKSTLACRTTGCLPDPTLALVLVLLAARRDLLRRPASLRKIAGGAEGGTFVLKACIQHDDEILKGREDSTARLGTENLAQLTAGT